jgi:hypothetical protein
LATLLAAIDQKSVERMRGAKMKLIQRLSLLSLVLTGLLTNSCALRSRTATEVSNTNNPVSVQNLSATAKLVENTTQGVRLTIPSNWETVENWRPDADLYAANPNEDMYVLVLVDPKDSLVSQFSLEDNAFEYRRNLVRQLDSFGSQTVTDLTSVNGKPAVQYEIKGQIAGAAVVYLHTTVLGDKNYYQVVGWTRADQYNSRKTNLQNVITTFRGT